jgi:hypothetical protein
VSPDFLLLIAPDRTYGRLLETSATRDWISVLGRCLLVALIIGAAIAIATTKRITIGLLLSLTLCWSFAVVLQFVAAAALGASSKQRNVSLAAAVDLIFLGHAPWSLWLIAMAMWSAFSPTGAHFTDGMMLTALIALGWRSAILFAFCRRVLQASRAGALLRTALHQVVILFFIFLYGAWAVDLWSRLSA